MTSIKNNELNANHDIEVINQAEADSSLAESTMVLQANT